LAVYKRKDPKDPDEIELLENLFDALCSALGDKENKQLFLQGEGIELMVIMIKEKKMARIRSVKVLDYAMSTKAGTANCLRFVEIMGLKTLFSIFSRKVKHDGGGGRKNESTKHRLILFLGHPTTDHGCQCSYCRAWTS
jgi:beta-catenin-like protein 1